MKQSPLPKVELRDVAPGLWIWRHEHPHWKPGQGWEPIVASTCVELRGETLLLDPLAPSEAAAEFWKRLDARPPTAVVVLKPDHVRDVDLFVRRYNARAPGPRCAPSLTFRSSASSSPTANPFTPAPPSSAPSASPPGRGS